MMYNNITMKRTNIYLDEKEFKLLKHIAVEEGRSFSDLVRQALRQFLQDYRVRPAPHRIPKQEWESRLEALLRRVQERTAKTKAEEIEEDITKASQEVRLARRKSHARSR
jgi:metal-responsive CopG/Arc/MetJ family transcriptional regulator